MADMKSLDSKLTEKEEAFVYHLVFNPACLTKPELAKEAAGYAPSNDGFMIAARLRKFIIAATEEYLAINGPKSATKLVDIIDNPVQKGATNSLKASQEILDRIGITKKQQLEVQSDAPIAVVILPPKDDT